MAFVRVKIIYGIAYEYLVENYREDGKVRQRMVEYLGRAPESKQPKEKRKKKKKKKKTRKE